MKAWAVVVALCATAHADPVEDAGGVAWMHYEATAVHDVAQTRGVPPARDLALASAHLHGILAPRHSRFGLHAGFDLALGATARGAAFAYDVQLVPIGIGMRLGETSFIAVAAGAGAMGAPGTISGAATFPVELDAEAGRGVRVLARARVLLVERASRSDGSPSAPFGDELDAMLGLRIGSAYDEYGFPSGNGLFVAAAYREMYGARYAGVTLGYSIDIARPR
jgi:hypothetical protein